MDSIDDKHTKNVKKGLELKCEVYRDAKLQVKPVDRSAAVSLIVFNNEHNEIIPPWVQSLE